MEDEGYFNGKHFLPWKMTIKVRNNSFLPWKTLKKKQKTFVFHGR